MDDAAACDDQLSRTPPRGWAVTLLSRFQRSSIVVNSFAFGIFLPFITDDLGLTPLQAGLLQAVWWVATAALTLPFGALFSRFRPVPLTLVSLTLVVPFVFLQGLAVNFLALFAARLLLVVSNLISIPARTLLLQQWAARRDYAIVNAVGLSQHSLLLAISISLSAVLIGAVGSWRTAYFIQGGLMVAQVVAWLVVAKEDHAPVSGFQVRLRAPQRSPIAAIRAYPQAWLIGVTMFFLAATWTAMVTFLPTLLLQDKGISLTLGGPLLAFLYYSLVPFALSAGWISRKVPNRKLLLAVPAVCNVGVGRGNHGYAQSPAADGAHHGAGAGVGRLSRHRAFAVRVSGNRAARGGRGRRAHQHRHRDGVRRGAGRGRSRRRVHGFAANGAAGPHADDGRWRNLRAAVSEPLPGAGYSAASWPEGLGPVSLAFAKRRHGPSHGRVLYNGV